MSLFGTLAEGGQTWAHRIRMLRQVLKLAMLVSLTLSAIVFISLMLRLHPVLYQSVWYHMKSSTLGLLHDTISVDSGFWETVAYERSSSDEILVSSKKVIAVTEPYMNLFYNKVEAILGIVGKVSFFCSVTVLSFFLIRGYSSKKKQHVSGRKQMFSYLLALRLRMKGKASYIKLGHLPLVKGTETQHIMVTGGTGSGKTNCYHHILPQIRNEHQRAVIVDTTGIFIERYFREGKDILLNPFDPRNASWHPWTECENAFDYEALAESFIPQSYSEHENYWRNAARALLSSVLIKTKNSQKNSELAKWLLFAPLPKLCEFVQGTKAAAHIDMNSERTAGSVRSVASSFLGSFEYLTDTDSPFSIRNWIQKDSSDSWLFLNCTPTQRASLNPLLSCWFSIAARGLLQLQQSFDRRIWFVVDELPSLNRLKDLETFLSESRKYGGCALLALQSPAQLETIYGPGISQTIIGNCATKIVFSEQDPEISEKISKAFGEREIKEYQEGLSYGAHEVRDGVSLSLQTRRLPLVSPTDIQTLEPNQAFIKLPGNMPITKIKLSIANS